jgi:hypothetical protein
MRPDLLRWQWSDYAARHANRTNLVVHLFAVALFQLGCLALLGSLLARSGSVALGGLAGLVIALAAQGRGHRLEAERPVPFTGPADFALRFLAEQWITFPRFVLSGGWLRSFRATP